MEQLSWSNALICAQLLSYIAYSQKQMDEYTTLMCRNICRLIKLTLTELPTRYERCPKAIYIRRKRFLNVTCPLQWRVTVVYLHRGSSYGRYNETNSDVRRIRHDSKSTERGAFTRSWPLHKEAGQVISTPFLL